MKAERRCSRGISNIRAYIAGITRKERQKDRPARIPEGGPKEGEGTLPRSAKGRKKQRASPLFQGWKEGRKGVRERPSRGSTMGPGTGGGTHKTEKHVISPRRGEKARPREISRAVLFFFSHPRTCHPTLRPASLGVGVPFLFYRFPRPFPLLLCAKATRRFLFVRINATAKYLVVTCRDFFSFFLYTDCLARGNMCDSCLTRQSAVVCRCTKAREFNLENN